MKGQMAWLLREGDVLASLEILDQRATRIRGLLGRPHLVGDAAVLLRPAKAVHTFGMTRPLDVVLCDADMVILCTWCFLPPRRLTRPRRVGRCVVEAEAGFVERWGLRPGDRLEVKE
ncbi:MAG TPA: DUF192 domain-containing protein [Acidimicrobiales bacterium]|nr:DUF192 domain-containing protein [Acidimicrobiales bacterium]